MKTKNKKFLVFTALAWCASANAGIFGISLSNSNKDSTGRSVEMELPDPYSEFLVLDEAIFENEQLSEIPGRLVAVVETEKGITILLPYADYIFKDDSKIPEIKVGEFNYDSYFLDTKSASNLGVPIAAFQLSGNYKVEYRFYKGATARMNLRDIDRKRFNDLALRVRADIAQQSNLKLKSLRIISAAATLHSAFAVIQGIKSESNITGPGWQIGGMFYSSQQMTKNRVKIGVSLVPYAEDVVFNKKMTPDSSAKPTDLALPNNQGSPVKPESIGLPKNIFQNLIQIDKKKI